MAVLIITGLYLLLGLLVAIFFAGRGVERALGQPVKISLGGRLVLMPGAMLLWPLVLAAWLKSGWRP